MTISDEIPLAAAVVRKIQDFGRVDQIVRELIDHDLFDDLSKHNYAWHAEDNDLGERLNDIRCKLSYVYDRILSIADIIDKDLR